MSPVPANIQPNIRPDFLGKQNLAQNKLINNEKSALGTKSGENFSSKVTGNKKNTKSNKAKKIAKQTAGAFIGLSLLLILIPILVLSIPIVIIGTIDYKLQETLGFDDTSAILEKQAEYVTAEQLGNGHINASYAADLEKNGLLVGQTTLAGNFVRTNTYIANIEEREIASIGGVYQRTDNGELAIKYNDEIISAQNFVAKVESDPQLYAAYSKALNISTRFYYSKEVSDFYEKYGFKKNNFSSWNTASSKEENNENFKEVLEKVLDADNSIGLNGYNKDNEKTFTTKVSDYESSDNLTNFIHNNVTGDEENATKKATSLLNIAVSAEEPYLAAKSYLLVEEAIQRTRITGNGPIDPLMDALSKENTVEVTDVNTGDVVSIKKSALKTNNFLAAISDVNFSKDDAASYSRDRIINTIGNIDSDTINETATASNGSDEFNLLVTTNTGNNSNLSTLQKANNSLTTTLFSKPSELFASSIGGNRIISGGSFLSNSINLDVLGAMPSDSETIISYNKEVQEVLARRKEADRTTLSPFDTSSPNTFLGSIVRQLSSAIIKNYQSSGRNSIVSSLSSMADVASSSILSLIGVVHADGNEAFTTMNGDCPTANSAANVEGDLYCNTHNTMNTSYMEYNLSDYKNSSIGNSINDDGSPVENGGLAQFIILGMGREMTVGPENSEICEKWKDIPGNQSMWGKIWDALTSAVGLYKSCRGVDSAIATGSYYTLSSSNKSDVLEDVKLYSSYTLYQTVSGLISDSKNQVTAFKERYYAENPLDDSEAGRLARRSGLTKEEAEIVLSYKEYLDFVASYNSSSRFKFAEPKLNIDGGITIFDDYKPGEILYLISRKYFRNAKKETSLTV